MDKQAAVLGLEESGPFLLYRKVPRQKDIN